MPLLSIVVPAYNEQDILEKTAAVISDTLSAADIRFEILFVNDGSRDGTWEKIQQAAKLNPRVRGISFSRNFGKESAILAGLSEAKGDCCAVIDCDLQVRFLSGAPKRKVPLRLFEGFSGFLMLTFSLACSNNFSGHAHGYQLLR